MDRSSNCCLEYDYCSHCTIRANKWKGKITVLYSHASSVPIDFIFVDTKAGCDHRIQCEKCGQHKFCFSSHTCKKKEHSDFPHNVSSHHNGSASFPVPETMNHISNSRAKSESAPSLFTQPVTPIVPQKTLNNNSSNSNPIFYKNSTQWNNNHHSLGHHHNGNHTILNNNSMINGNNGFINHNNNNNSLNNHNFFNPNANGNYEFNNNLNANYKSQSTPVINNNNFQNNFFPLDDQPTAGSYCQFLESSQHQFQSNDMKQLSDKIVNFGNKMLNSNSLLKQQLQSQSQDQDKKLTPSEEMLYEVWSTEFGSKEKIDEGLLNQLLRKIHSTCDNNTSLPTLASWKSFLVAKIVVSTGIFFIIILFYNFIRKFTFFF